LVGVREILVLEGGEAEQIGLQEFEAVRHDDGERILLVHGLLDVEQGGGHARALPAGQTDALEFLLGLLAVAIGHHLVLELLGVVRVRVLAVEVVVEHLVQLLLIGVVRSSVVQVVELLHGRKLLLHLVLWLHQVQLL